MHADLDSLAVHAPGLPIVKDDKLVGAWHSGFDAEVEPARVPTGVHIVVQEKMVHFLAEGCHAEVSRLESGVEL